jgi:hypothetical protein
MLSVNKVIEKDPEVLGGYLSFAAHAFRFRRCSIS